MNPHLKVAYDQGVQKALIDAGLTKESGTFTRGGRPTEVEPPGRTLSRIGHETAGAFVGAAGGGLGAIGLLALLSGISRGKLKSEKLTRNVFGAGTLLGSAGGFGIGRAISQENDPLYYRLKRKLKKALK